MRREILKTRWYCSYNHCKQGYDLYLSAKLKENLMRGGALPESYIAKEVEFVEQELNNDYPPFLNLKENQAQELMDALWKSGLRPTEVGSAGQLSAVQNHLADMQKIVFDSFLSRSTTVKQGE